MNYKRHYNLLIQRAKEREAVGYVEKHHVIPRCLGGSDAPSNIVRLTPEEHYVAHQLLAKLHPADHGLLYAAFLMSIGRPSNKLYGWIRRRFSEQRRSLVTGSKNPVFGTKFIYNNELRKSVRVPADAIIPEGWTLGRRFNFDNRERPCKHCGKLFDRECGYYCSVTCRRRALSSPATRTIDANVEAMVQLFSKTKSITKTLRAFGIVGTRAGNAYFSAILKSKGIQPSRRRNSRLGEIGITNDL